jgi:hypothetical protein
MLSVSHFNVLRGSSSLILSNSTISGCNFFEVQIFDKEGVAKHIFGDGDGQTGSNEFPKCVEPLKLLVALPLQCFDVLPRVLLLEGSIRLEVVDHPDKSDARGESCSAAQIHGL